MVSPAVVVQWALGALLISYEIYMEVTFGKENKKNSGSVLNLSWRGESLLDHLF